MSTPAPHALNTPPWQRVETTMMTAARDIRLAYDCCFEALELNLSQATLIGYVHENGPMTQTQLAGALVLGKASTGSLVDQLEQRGLVQRVPDPDDRRVWLVENTLAGAELAVEIIEVDRRLRTRLRSGITSAERRQLADLLIRMSENAQEAFAEQSATKNP
ncbi:MAG: MarR family transcriptional regulator [Actinomycetota bacterium]